MKKLIIIAVMLSIFAAATPVFAQKISDKHRSEYYFVNIPVEKIFHYRLGYVVQYRQGIGRVGTLYIPHSWFSEPASKGELVWMNRGNEWPTLTVFYKEGEFTHLRLYIHRWKGHQTWGAVPMNVNIDDRFDVDSLEVVY